MSSRLHTLPHAAPNTHTPAHTQAGCPSSPAPPPLTVWSNSRSNRAGRSAVKRYRPNAVLAPVGRAGAPRTDSPPSAPAGSPPPKHIWPQSSATRHSVCLGLASDPVATRRRLKTLPSNLTEPTLHIAACNPFSRTTTLRVSPTLHNFRTRTSPLSSQRQGRALPQGRHSHPRPLAGCRTKDPVFSALNPEREQAPCRPPKVVHPQPHCTNDLHPQAPGQHGEPPSPVKRLEAPHADDGCNR